MFPIPGKRDPWTSGGEEPSSPSTPSPHFLRPFPLAELSQDTHPACRVVPASQHPGSALGSSTSDTAPSSPACAGLLPHCRGFLRLLGALSRGQGEKRGRAAQGDEAGRSFWLRAPAPRAVIKTIGNICALDRA